ncbi:MAG: DUF4170 domain-containing protein [Arenibacterium sp.]
MVQRLHLIIGDERLCAQKNVLSTWDESDVVGLFPNDESSHAAMTPEAGRIVEIALMRPRFAHLQRLRDAEAKAFPTEGLG